MKNASTLPVFMRLLFLLACSISTVTLYVVFMIPLIWIMTPMGLSNDAINTVALIFVALLYTAPLYFLYFSEYRMDPAKRFFLANSAAGWKPLDMLKRYFIEFGAMDCILAAIPVLVTVIGILLEIKGAGLVVIPVGAFQPQNGVSLLGILVGILLFCVEYAAALLLRFYNWDRNRLHR